MTFEQANAKGDPSLFGISTSVTDLCSSCTHCGVCTARPKSWVQECRYYLEGECTNKSEEPRKLPHNTIGKKELRSILEKVVNDGYEVRMYVDEYTYFNLDMDNIDYITKMHSKKWKALGFVSYNLWDKYEHRRVNTVPIRSRWYGERLMKEFGEGYTLLDMVKIIPFKINKDFTVTFDD